jgi:hypothetical protein
LALALVLYAPHSFAWRDRKLLSSPGVTPKWSHCTCFKLVAFCTYSSLVPRSFALSSAGFNNNEIGGSSSDSRRGSQEPGDAVRQTETCSGIQTNKPPQALPAACMTFGACCCLLLHLSSGESPSSSRKARPPSLKLSSKPSLREHLLGRPRNSSEPPFPLH